ncbi:MAG: hypothetical protein IKR49_00635 [Clostridia bacterium]|nr:hypothetical protein [Clostridia bacterium]
MTYTSAEIRLRLETLSSDLSNLYKDPCINYRGQTTDTGEPYTEVIAAWLLAHLSLLDTIRPITRQSSYCVAGHDGIPEHPDSNREEELIAMAMKRQGVLPLVGQVLDYQTPLKNRRKDKAGKIDLLAFDGTTLRILELKEPDSKETMLRCVLEGYTYLKTVDQEKLLTDFGLPADTPVEACPFVFYGGFQWNEMQQDRPNLKTLMAALHSKPYYVKSEGHKYIITEE